MDWYHERLLTVARRRRRPQVPPRPGLRRRRGPGRAGSAGRPTTGTSWCRRCGCRRTISPTPASASSTAAGAQDFFRGRVLFPIFDADGDAGRLRRPDHARASDGPKYKNTSETTLYDKSQVLYALNWAKAGIVEADEVIVCEGYTDVIGFFRVGVPRAVATCGTALTEEHVRLLRRFARRIVLAFDADAAGQAAAERFYQWEAKYELEVVGRRPARRASTPATWPARDPEALVAAVADARPFLEFRLDRDPRRRRPRHAPRAGPGPRRTRCRVIVEHPNELVRDQYLMEVADRCRVDVAPPARAAPVGQRQAAPAAAGAEAPTAPASRRRPGPREPGDDDDPAPARRARRDPAGSRVGLAPPSRSCASP